MEQKINYTTPAEVLKNVFGYDEYKPLQREVIENVLARRDTLAIMPTGGGKSLCYQIPALIFPGLTVVVSPLISLMKDQVEQMNAAGVPALFLNSSLSYEAYQENMDRVWKRQVKLLYVAPETLLTQRILDLLDKVGVDCLTIDEAHCISEWGHDFRPEYRQLLGVRARFPGAVCLALTATATPRVRTDIMNTMHFDAADEFVASFNRENLNIEVAPKQEPLAQTLEFLERFPDQSGIIYCFSRKQVDDLAGFLGRKGYSVRPYHAGLEDDARRRNQELFIRDDVQIIVATIAFGMGINKPNVRFILHYDLPKSIEGYYQEIGRAGRDGLPSTCRLLYSYSDIMKLKYFIDQKDTVEQRVAYEHLEAMRRYAESETCRRVPLLAYFGETYTADNCGMCDRCLDDGSSAVDITVAAQKFLSCVYRTGESFGAVHVVDVLLGSENQKILKFGHQALTTYGIGKDLGRKQWLHIGRQLVAKGLLVQDDLYGSLKLTRAGRDALRNRELVMGTLLVEKKPAAAKKYGELDFDQGLFDVLRRLRKQLADEAHVPPYVIFSDRTLVELAAYRPLSAESLLEINGVGQVKSQSYGPAFLEAVRAYCREHGLAEVSKPRSVRAAPAAAARAQTEPDGSARHQQVAAAYNAGQSIPELMEQYGVKQGTILEHLQRYAQEGHSLRRGPDLLGLSKLPSVQQTAALQAFAELGADLLKPVFERLDGTVDYDELKILRLIYLSQP
jgi:ATP-dependent DNA helicase RecQ